jgi:lipopolysaccharide/colanic/teichoic acid biosynthesis glycosyltransferase
MTGASYDTFKRVGDLLVASFVLVLTAPVQAAVACAVRATAGSPVLFRQRRPGLHGRPITVVKIRTMREAPAGTSSADDGARLTRLGSWLRATSLDEMPTLWCVVKGDMSLVGPRPLLMEYLDRYTPEQARRHEVRPGVTGLAQVSGRNGLTWEAKFALDVEYVERRSLRLDLWILARTVRCVLRREGIAADGSATMPEFRASAPPEAQP